MNNCAKPRLHWLGRWCLIFEQIQARTVRLRQGRLRLFLTFSATVGPTSSCMTASSIQPGFIALHSHRSEVLADTLTGWLRAHPLHPLESEVVLVQSNGMAEWIKI